MFSPKHFRSVCSFLVYVTSFVGTWKLTEVGFGHNRCYLVTDAYTLCLKKGTPTLSTVTLKRINGFWRFLAQIFLKQQAIKWLFNFPPHLTSASTLPGEKRT